MRCRTIIPGVGQCEEAEGFEHHCHDSQHRPVHRRGAVRWNGVGTLGDAVVEVVSGPAPVGFDPVLMSEDECVVVVTARFDAKGMRAYAVEMAGELAEGREPGDMVRGLLENWADEIASRASVVGSDAIPSDLIEDVSWEAQSR